MAAARSAFAREGYSRASIEAIAGAASVSTRTIYNHFESKEALFAAVLEASAAQVADSFLAILDEKDDGCDINAELVALGLALRRARARNAEHFALVRQINAEKHRFPSSTIETWQEVGPRRIESEVSLRLQALSDRGLLRTADPRLAAAHFIALTAAEVTVSSTRHLPSPGEEEVEAQVRAGVDAFIHGYGRNPGVDV